MGARDQRSQRVEKRHVTVEEVARSETEVRHVSAFWSVSRSVGGPSAPGARRVVPSRPCKVVAQTPRTVARKRYVTYNPTFSGHNMQELQNISEVSILTIRQIQELLPVFVQPHQPASL